MRFIIVKTKNEEKMKGTKRAIGIMRLHAKCVGNKGMDYKKKKCTEIYNMEKRLAEDVPIKVKRRHMSNLAGRWISM